MRSSKGFGDDLDCVDSRPNDCDERDNPEDYSLLHKIVTSLLLVFTAESRKRVFPFENSPTSEAADAHYLRAITTDDFVNRL
jgi:hypothetical protein